jgi:hypothetical protein
MTALVMPPAADRAILRAMGTLEWNWAAEIIRLGTESRVLFPLHHRLGSHVPHDSLVPLRAAFP